MIANVYQTSRLVSPQQSIRLIATYAVGPLTRIVDEATGCSNAKVKLLGYKIPCSFSTLGILVTETLQITASPAEWAAYKTVSFISNYFASKVITIWNLEEQGDLGREVAAAIQIGFNVIFQVFLEKVEKTKMIASTYKKVDDKLNMMSKPVNEFLYKQISKGLEILGVDTTQPLRFTKTEHELNIEREENLLASEVKVVDIEQKIEELKKQEKELQEKGGNRDKTAEENKQDADRIIQKAREYEKNCPEKTIEHKYKKHKKYKHVWAKHISYQLVREYNISEEQRSNIENMILQRLREEHGKKAHNKAMKEVISVYRAILQNKSKMELNDVRRALSNMQYKLIKAKEQYKTNKNIFAYQQYCNTHHQARYKNEEQKKTKMRLKNSNSGVKHFTISPQELKELGKHIDKCLKELGKRNIENNKILLNGEVNMFCNSLGNLMLKIPIKIHNKRMKFHGKDTNFNADLCFSIQLESSSPGNIIDINVDTTNILRLFSTFQGMREESKSNQQLNPALNQTVSDIQLAVDIFLLRENMLRKLDENLPEGAIIKPGIFNVGPRLDSSFNQILDIGFNADFEYQISSDNLKDAFTDNSIDDYSFEKIRNIEITDGRVKVEFPLSGAINGSVVGSFDLIFYPERQVFSFNNLEVRPQNNASSLIKYFNETNNSLKNILLGHLENYINRSLENIRLFAINSIQQQLHEKCPSNLFIDKESITINNIICNNNNITLHFSLRSSNTSSSKTSITYGNNEEHAFNDILMSALTFSF